MTRLARTMAAIGAACLMSSCATKVPLVNDEGAARLDPSQGVIFGRIAVEKNGQAFTTDIYKNGTSPSVAAHLSPFESVEKLQRNEWKPGKWFFLAQLTTGGYFSATLPAGKYYFVEFIFLDVAPSMLALRTYESTGLADIRLPMIVAFEVLPGKTTYLGTLVHRIDDGGVERPRSFGWTLDVADESAEASQWFRTQHPRSDAIETLLARKTPLN